MCTKDNLGLFSWIMLTKRTPNYTSGIYFLYLDDIELLQGYMQAIHGTKYDLELLQRHFLASLTSHFASASGTLHVWPHAMLEVHGTRNVWDLFPGVFMRVWLTPAVNCTNFSTNTYLYQTTLMEIRSEFSVIISLSGVFHDMTLLHCCIVPNAVFHNMKGALLWYSVWYRLYF